MPFGSGFSVNHGDGKNIRRAIVAAFGRVTVGQVDGEAGQGSIQCRAAELVSVLPRQTSR